MQEMNLKNMTSRKFIGKIRLANEFKTRAKGLLGTSGLPAFQGLLLKPCKQVHMFGMKYPLSVWFIDRDLKIIKIIDQLMPWRISPYVSKASFVIEFPEKWAEITGSREGDYLGEYSPAASSDIL